ncbi:hypothetical protein PVAND_001521 [Polypedilum vanderplanki]|uniref:Uncharacterized protein n=1 Tax=Polypedilum vanderplanki TaxID=319348 RepID=A0A9J6BNP3_POLVA|nr:hypothetical protein PVAND_001521 [Polypedilum vanderplanki]
MNNLLDKLNTSWANELKTIDPDVFVYKNYIVSGHELHEIVDCEASECQYELAGRSAKRKYGKGEKYRIGPIGSEKIEPITVSFVFCFACNSIGHAQCMNFKALREDNAVPKNSPWICEECKENPNNERAKEFYKNQGYTESLFDRANNFRKETAKIVKHISIDDGAHDETEIHELDDKQQIDLLRDRCQQEIDAKTRLQIQVEQQAELIAKLQSKERKSVNFVENEFVSSSPKSRTSVDQTLYKEYMRHRGNNGPSSSRSSVSQAPLPKTDVSKSEGLDQRSFIDSLREDELTKSERIALHQTQATIAASSAQLKISQNVALESVRKALPKITNFDGDASKWIQFNQDIKLYKEIGQFDELPLKLHIRKSLSGLALARVKDIFDSTPLYKIMQLLEDSFGEPTRIIDRAAEEILSIRINRSLFKDDVMLINTKIQAYFQACIHAGVDYANTHHLARHLFDQLNLSHKMLYRTTTRKNDENKVKLVDLESLYSFFEELYCDLEAKKVDYNKNDNRNARNQVMSVASTSSGLQSQSSRYGSYEIKNKEKNDVGYDIAMLNKIDKTCFCCGMNNHYTVQCRKFYRLDQKAKLKFIFEKHLCKCCIVSKGHRANDCQLNSGCGYQSNGQVCGLKHHVSLHSTSQFQRNNNERRKPNNNANSVNASSVEDINLKGDDRKHVDTIIQNAPSIKQVPQSQTGGQNTFENPFISQRMKEYAAKQGNSISVGQNAVKEVEINVIPYEIKYLTSPVGQIDAQRTVIALPK